MDIFTTQLAQASQVIAKPIRPEKLKVKALLKDARLGKLKDDRHELNEDAFDFYQSAHHSSANEQDDSMQQTQQEVVELSEQALELINSNDNSSVSEEKEVNKNRIQKSAKHTSEKISHLDVFI